jgi:hypothetical protein
MDVGKWKAGVTAKRWSQSAFPKHHGSGILTLDITPNPGSSKGCLLEKSVGMQRSAARSANLLYFPIDM